MFLRSLALLALSAAVTRGESSQVDRGHEAAIEVTRAGTVQAVTEVENMVQLTLKTANAKTDWWLRNHTSSGKVSNWELATPPH